MRSTGFPWAGDRACSSGLNHPEYFTWIGGFSSALPYASFDDLFPRLTATPSPQLLWIACATEEEDIAATRKFVAWLKARGLSPTAVETPGIHNWHTWRNNFVQFAPVLFRPAVSVASDEQQLVDLEQAWVKAELAHDRATLQRILERPLRLHVWNR